MAGEGGDNDEVARVFQRDILPSICNLQGAEIDELVDRIVAYRNRRVAPQSQVVNMQIALGLVMTGVLRENPLEKRYLELKAANTPAPTEGVFIQSGVNQPNKSANAEATEGEGGPEAPFDAEKVYQERVQSIAHKLGGCGAGKGYAAHTHKAGSTAPGRRGRFSIYSNTASLIGDGMVQYY